LIKLISDTPWYFYLLSLSVGILFTLSLYYKEKKTGELPPSIRKILLGIRFMGVTLLCLLLSNLFLKRVINKTENPTLLIAVDNSTSIISGNDSLKAKDALLKGVEKMEEELGKIFTIKKLIFGERTRLSDSLNFTDKETDIANLLSDITNNFSGQNIGALILASDGIVNKGTNPIYAVDKIKFPIYSIALGDTTEKKDALIQKIDHNQVAYLGNQFVAEISISALKLKDEECTVTIYKNQVKKGEQKIKFNSQNFISSFNFVLEADAPGVQKYSVIIAPVKGETNLSNNQQTFVIDVIDSRDKILILSNSPHPDIAAISESIESMKNYELIKDFTSNPNRILKPFSLVIIHNYSQSNKAILNECISNHIPYLVINPSLNAGLTEVKINASIDRLNDAEPSLNSSFGLFTISDELKNLLKNLPAVKTYFGKYTVTNGSQILLQQQIGSVSTGDPILLFNENNDIKSAVFIGDGLWKWRLRNYQENTNFNAFNELISKTIQYLSVKSDKSFFRVFTEKIINENEPVEFSAEVYNKSYELVNEMDVTMILKNASGKTFNYTFSKQNNSYKLNAGFLSPGEYTYEAKVKSDNTIQVKKGILIVKAVVSEKINTVANHGLLNKLSKSTNGKLFYLTQLDSLRSEIQKNEMIKPITYSQNETTDLIDLKWIFIFILVLFSLEWFLRKYNGLI
jgi:hypothetical protein